MTGLLPRRLQVALYRTSTYWRLAQVSLIILYLVILALLFGLWMPRDYIHPSHHAVRDLPDIPPPSPARGDSAATPIDRVLETGTAVLANPDRVGRALERIDEALADPDRVDRALQRVLGTTGGTD
jgi:hypothetical protein